MDPPRLYHDDNKGYHRVLSCHDGNPEGVRLFPSNLLIHL